MQKITSKDYLDDGNKSFVDFYKSLPGRCTVEAPKTKFVRQIAGVTKKSTKTVRMWLAKVQRPDALTQSVISEYLNTPTHILFPENDKNDRIE